MKIEGKEWKLVPVEATAEMEEAHYQAHADSENVFASVPEVWRAVISAAPAPDIEAMVEGVAKVMSLSDGGTIPWDERCREDLEHGRECARAVLRHLLGEG
jgi:acyl-CoA reductase-like NAD-dependent aldehyde dehydrogenase